MTVRRIQIKLNITRPPKEERPNLRPRKRLTPRTKCEEQQMIRYFCSSSLIQMEEKEGEGA